MAVVRDNIIYISERDFQDTIEFFDKAADAFGDRWLKNTQARRARKHFVPAMQQKVHSARLMEMISVTTARKYTKGPRSIRVGVVKNDTSLFPKFSAQALASVLEYGTEERFIKTGVFSAKSTGSMPSSPALRPGFDENVDPFMHDVERSIEKKFDKETR